MGAVGDELARELGLHLRAGTVTVTLIIEQGGKRYFPCMYSASTKEGQVQKKRWQGGNLMKIAIFSMEIRAYLNWSETTILH